MTTWLKAVPARSVNRALGGKGVGMKAARLTRGVRVIAGVLNTAFDSIQPGASAVTCDIVTTLAGGCVAEASLGALRDVIVTIAAE